MGVRGKGEWGRKRREGEEGGREEAVATTPVVGHEVSHLGKILACCGLEKDTHGTVSILPPSLTFQKLHALHYMWMRVVHLHLKTCP